MRHEIRARSFLATGVKREIYWAAEFPLSGRKSMSLPGSTPNRNRPFYSLQRFVQSDRHHTRLCSGAPCSIMDEASGCRFTARVAVIFLWLFHVSALNKSRGHGDKAPTQ